MKYLVFLFDCSLQLSLAPDAIARVVARQKAEWIARIEHMITLLTFDYAAGNTHSYSKLIEYKKLRSIVNASTLAI